MTLFIDYSLLLFCIGVIIGSTIYDYIAYRRQYKASLEMMEQWPRSGRSRRNDERIEEEDVI